MDFSWADEKSDWCLRQRGFDLAYAARVFDGETVEFVDDRHSYPEPRIIAFGFIDGLLYAVVYTDRDDGTRFIITAFRARKREVKRWHRRATAAR